MLVGFFVGVGILVLSFLFAAINMARMAGHVKNFDFDGADTGFSRHMYSMVGFFIGTMVALICGIGYLLERFGH